MNVIEIFNEWTDRGLCPALIFDDNGHWAVVMDGFQSLPMGDEPEDVSTTYWIEAKDWHDTIEQAIQATIDAWAAEEAAATAELREEGNG